MPPFSWIAALRAADGCRLRAPVTPAGLDTAECELEVTFPGELRALYLASDGVLDEPGQWFVIWPLADLVSRNQAGLGCRGQHPPETARLRRRRHRVTLLRLAQRRS